MTKLTQIYLILGAIGYEPGPPIAFFQDPFKAKIAFAEIKENPFIPALTAFLIAYEVQKDGSLKDVGELCRKWSFTVASDSLILQFIYYIK